MTMLICAAVAACVVLLWPSQVKIGLLQSLVSRPASAPSYRSCIDSLAQVRRRLLLTDSVDEKTKAAIETLTLALVNGSDK